MFARMLEFSVKPERKVELTKTVRNEIIPALKSQPGFVDALELERDVENTEVLLISLWRTKADAERYMMQFYPRVKRLIGSFMAMPVLMRFYEVNTSASDLLFDAIAV